MLILVCDCLFSTGSVGMAVYDAMRTPRHVIDCVREFGVDSSVCNGNMYLPNRVLVFVVNIVDLLFGILSS